MRSFFNSKTLQVKSLSFKTIFYCLLFAILIILGCEFILRIENVRSQLSTFSLGYTDRYPELDIKLQRLDELIKTEPINCFLVGSSMVDAGIDPQILSHSIDDQVNQKYRCFNFGVSGAMVDTTGTIMELLVKLYKPDLIILGTSAVEYDRHFDKSIDIGEIPWIQYKLGHFTLEGWVADHSLIYRSLLTYKKMNQVDFEDEYLLWEQFIDDHGFRVWKNQSMDVSGIDEIMLNDFKIDQVDLDQLESITVVEDQGTKVVIVEMPVYPAFFPNYVEGGEAAYTSLFINPITDRLQTQGNTLIRSQPFISSIVAEDGWYNKNHLNTGGAKDFSTWLGQQIKLSNQ